VHFEGRRITGFSGNKHDVQAAQDHYEMVGELFDLDPMTMHSWHAGIHPGGAFGRPAAENFERWSGAAFGNPRLLHFHSCGDLPPGEISLNVLDPTICVDGANVWDAGRFDPNFVDVGPTLLAQYNCIKAVFDNPSRSVGECVAGGLSGEHS